MNHADGSKAAKNITEDLDLIDEIFSNINETLQDIRLLKDLQLEEDRFADRLLRIYISWLDFCLFSTQLFKKRSRLSEFVISIMLNC